MKLRGIGIATVVLALTFLLAAATASPRETGPKNVLFLVADDLNARVGCLKGHPRAKTPNIDRLAARGTVFTNAHCQAPLCNASRSSFLTGLRPSTTGIHGLMPGIRDVASLKEHVTLPQTFTQQGHFTYSSGKIYHGGSIRRSDRAREFNIWGPAPGMPRPDKKFVHTPNPHPLVDWGVFPEHDEDQPDWKAASAAIEALQNAPRDRPFFIACGFRLPHVPCYASQKWFDLYPEDTLQLPPVDDDDRDDTPRFSWYLHWKLPEPRLKFLKESGEWKSLVRAYLASVSFMDSQVGRVLDGLEATGRSNETIVVFLSDHGWHLGEKQITGKNSLWEESTRVPLIFAGPKIANGADCKEPVELLDIFPTLLELCGLPARPDLEGHSLVPQLRDASAPRKWPAITTHNQGNHTVRTRDLRYIRYADGSEELYDHRADPNEWTNRASDPRYADRKRELKAMLPTIDLPAAPGSAHRVLNYDPETGAVIWEGQPVQPGDPIPEIED